MKISRRYYRSHNTVGSNNRLIVDACINPLIVYTAKGVETGEGAALDHNIAYAERKVCAAKIGVEYTVFKHDCFTSRTVTITVAVCMTVDKHQKTTARTSILFL